MAQLSLREIASRVGRSHTHVQRFVSSRQLSPLPRERLLVGCRLVFEHGFDPDEVAAWLRRNATLPAVGFLASVDGRIAHFGDPDAVASLLQRTDLTGVRIAFVSALADWVEVAA